ncbi:hypothetical protein EUA98_01720 [Pengzhenrongella frigida]|uniref:Uncharacterized protein n=1 Tax=Pengzhenrongella frigida TaxID=1259133 RepID=A0A4Q5N6W5_9MICO|nr:hypothetical protein EUA98_01720 [Cellulomonas sp. HLT2-17]
MSETASLPATAPWRNHGRTIAAWTAVTVVLVGGILASFGVLAALPWLFWVGMAVVVVGVVAGKVLQMAGYGQGGKYTLARAARARAEGRSH